MNNPTERESSGAAHHLIALAQRSLSGEPPKRNAASLERVERALAQRARQHRIARVWGGAGMLALASFALFFFAFAPFGQDDALQFQVTHGVVAESGFIDGTTQGTKLRFSDGTELALAAHARTRVGPVSAHGAEISLEHGSVNVHVVPRPGARWSIRAGAYLVNVTGTTFEVEFEPDRRWLAVELSTGSVSVSGPLIEGGLVVSAGQRMMVRPEDGLVLVQRGNSHAAEQAPPDVASPSSSADAGHSALDDSADVPAAEVARPRMARKAAPGGTDQTWSQKVVAGRFNEVIALAERRELDRVYQAAGFEDLQALADAARYARRNDVARPALLAIRKRFSASLAARQAAFFLGRLEEGAGATASALNWYDDYLARSPKGAYASQALGRKLLIIHGEQGAEAARPVARQYLQRFPEGPYAATAAKLAGGSSQ